METIHVEFDELKEMASEQFSSGPNSQLLTSGLIRLGLVPNPPLPSVVSLVPPTTAPIPAHTTGTPSSTIIDQDAPYASTLPTIEETLCDLEPLSLDFKLPEIINLASSFDYPSYDVFKEDVDYQSSRRLCNLSFLDYLILYFFEYEHVALNSTRHGLDDAAI
ncbi:hypothetical protein Tco_0603412 [Tanacetum coccineum]